MQWTLNRNVFLAAIAYLYWFLENGKYGIALLFFANNPTFLFVVTAFVSIGLSVITVLGCLKFFCAGKLTRNDVETPREVKLLWMLMGLAGVSLLWTNMFEFNFKVWVSIVLSMVVFTLASLYGNARLTAEQTVKGFIYGAVFTALVALLLQPIETASIHRLGLFGLIDATRLGRMMGVAALMNLYFLFTASDRKQRLKYTGVLVILLTTLIFTFAKVSIVSLFVSGVVMILLFPFSKQIKSRVLAVVLMAAAVFVTLSYDRIIGYTKLMGGNALSTASGRTTYWTVSWAMIKENPWLGYGAGARLNLDQLPQDIDLGIFDVKPTQTHNEWMNMWFQYGLLGLFLTVMIYGLLVMRTVQAYHRGEKELAALCLSVLVLTFLRSPFESDLVGFILPEPFLIIFPFWVKDQMLRRKLSQALAVRDRILAFRSPPRLETMAKVPALDVEFESA